MAQNLCSTFLLDVQKQIMLKTCVPINFLIRTLKLIHIYFLDTLSTVGVDVGIWKYRKDLDGDQLRIKKKGNKPMRSVTFYTWDFGGQVSVGRREPGKEKNTLHNECIA